MALINKEFRQFFRSKPLVILVIWTIAVEIAICAYAITYDVTHIAMVVQDLDGSPRSRELRQRFAQTPAFTVRYQTMEAGELDRLLELRWIRRTVGHPGPLPSLRLQARAWYSPDLRSVHFVVVSMLVLGVMLIAMLHPAAALAWEKEAGTIEQLLVMPFRTWELMVAKVVPTFVVSLTSLALALWVPWWFEVPIRGSLLLFFALSALFLLSALGLGLMFGTLAENLQQALLLGFFTIFPLFVISGTMVPVESMPQPIQYLSYVSPLRYYLDIGLSIFLKGVGMRVLWPQARGHGGPGRRDFCPGTLAFPTADHLTGVRDLGMLWPSRDG